MTPVSSVSKYYVFISSSWVQLNDARSGGAQWGIMSNEPEARIADVGERKLTLDNSDGRYTVGGPSALSGWRTGLPFKWEVTYNSKTYIKFLGFIERIPFIQNPGEKTITITALDWFSYAQKQPVIIPSLLTDATIDEAINEILPNAPIQPQETEVSVGDYSFPYLLDGNRKETKLYSEFAKLTMSELGYMYLRHSGTYGEKLVIQNNTDRNGTNTLTRIPADTGPALLLQGGGYLLLQSGGRRLLNVRESPTFDASVISYKDITYGTNIKNRFTVNAYPKKTDTDVKLIYESEKPIRISAGETLPPFRAFWRDPQGKRPINAVPPTQAGGVVALINFSSNSVSGGAASGGLDGVWHDETGKIATHNDVPFIGFSKYDDGSAYFDGSLAWITYPDSPAWDWGSGDFWVEWWEWRNATTANMCILSRDGTDSVPSYLIGNSNGTSLTISLSSNSTTFDIANGVSMGSVGSGAWNHYAAGRRSGTLYTFKNGTLITSVSASGTISPASTALYIGRNNATYLDGNINGIKIVKGRCLHIASFTPSEPLLMEVGSYYEMNTSEDFTGTDVSDYLTHTERYGTEGFIQDTLTNTYTGACYIRIKIYGYGIANDSPIEGTVQSGDETTGSVYEYGYKNTNLSQGYQQDTVLGLLEANKVIDLEKNPRTTLNKIGMWANRSSTTMRSFLYYDIGDLVYIYLPDDGIDSYFYIQGISTTDVKNLNYFEWIVQQAWILEKGLEHVAVEFAGGTATDAITYEYNPLVSADSITNRVFSFWIYLDALDAGDNQTIMDIAAGAGSTKIYVPASGASAKIAIRSGSFVTNGIWTSGDTFATGSYYHVLVHYDRSSTANNASIYFNGVQVLSPVESPSPSGNAVSEEGSAIVIGNSVAGTESFNGKIKDIRIYDMDNSLFTVEQLAAGIYAEGAGGNRYYGGMLFNPFVVRSEDEASFEDLTLTDEKILEAFKGYIGSVSGSPIVRLL